MSDAQIDARVSIDTTRYVFKQEKKTCTLQILKADEQQTNYPVTLRLISIDVLLQSAESVKPNTRPEMLQSCEDFQNEHGSVYIKIEHSPRLLKDNRTKPTIGQGTTASICFQNVKSLVWPPTFAKTVGWAFLLGLFYVIFVVCQEIYTRSQAILSEEKK